MSVKGRRTTGRRHSASGMVAAFLLVAALLMTAAWTPGAAEKERRWAILISGASGDPELQKTYLGELTDLYSVLENSLGFSPERIAVLFDDPSMNPDIIRGKSTREGLQALCRRLSTQVKPDDLMFVFIEGHGDYNYGVYKLNLAGRHDPTGAELAAMLYSIHTRRFIVVNMTNCSGGSIPALSEKGKIIVTATKSGMEKNRTRAARFFIDSLKNNSADSNKDGRVSMMEAFSYTVRKVEEYYKSEGILQTEHAAMDDNGDSRAESRPGPDNGEGLLAGTTFLDAGVPAAEQAGLTPEQQQLAREAREIQSQIEALKYAKSGMPEAEYEKKLEELLLRLAQINSMLPE